MTLFPKTVPSAVAIRNDPLRRLGRDSISVVDGRLKVYGIERLRIADASIMPNITSGNTMAPCVVIGERAADMIRVTYGI